MSNNNKDINSPDQDLLAAVNKGKVSADLMYICATGDENTDVPAPTPYPSAHKTVKLIEDRIVKGIAPTLDALEEVIIQTADHKDQAAKSVNEAGQVLSNVKNEGDAQAVKLQSATDLHVSTIREEAKVSKEIADKFGDVDGAVDKTADNAAKAEVSLSEARFVTKDIPRSTQSSKLLSKLSNAKHDIVKIRHFGTSISSFSRSGNKLFVEQLKKIYGDATGSTEWFSGLGGTFNAPKQGWEKQPYNGLFFNRARGNANSETLRYYRRCNKIDLFFSREAGGSDFVVKVDGQARTISCNGSETSYNNRATWDDLGFDYHEIEIEPPETGFTYLERVRFGVPYEVSNGIEEEWTSFGGSSIGNIYGNRQRAKFTGAGQVGGIQTTGSQGIDAHFNNEDSERPDIIIVSGPVNDSVGVSHIKGDFTYIINEAIRYAETHDTALVFLIEMSGHHAMPNSGSRDSYLAAREVMLAASRRSANALAVDWHGQYDLNELYPFYNYGLSDYDFEAHTYNGDFIHPNAQACSVATALLCQKAGIPTPDVQDYHQLNSSTSASIAAATFREQNSEPVPAPIGTVLMDSDGVEKRLVSCEGAVDMGTEKRRGLWDVGVYHSLFSGSNALLSDSEIASRGLSVESDRFGRYVVLQDSDKGIPSGKPVKKGFIYTLTITLSGSANIRLSDTGFTFDLNKRGEIIEGRAGFIFRNTASIESPETFALTFTAHKDFRPTVTVRNFNGQGKIYRLLLTRGCVAPVEPIRKVQTQKLISSAVELSESDELDINNTMIGQQIIDNSGLQPLRKRLLNHDMVTPWLNHPTGEGVWEVINGSVIASSNTLTPEYGCTVTREFSPTVNNYINKIVSTGGNIKCRAINISPIDFTPNEEFITISFAVNFHKYNRVGLELYFINGSNNTKTSYNFAEKIWTQGSVGQPMTINTEEVLNLWHRVAVTVPLPTSAFNSDILNKALRLSITVEKDTDITDVTIVNGKYACIG